MIRIRALIGSGLVVVTLAVGFLDADGGGRVQVRDGLVSADFEGTPLPEALDLIQRETGVEIVVPASVRGKTLTLAVQQASFEQFVRRVLAALELGGFAVVYEASGAAQRVIVVDRAQGGTIETEVPGTAPQPAPVTPDSDEPVYIPPATPPVYIPPTTPPVYIPPTTPPVYIPPTTPPQEAPPSP